MMFIPNGTKLCRKKSIEQPNLKSIHKLTSSNFKYCGGGGEEEEEENEEEEEEQEEDGGGGGGREEEAGRGGQERSRTGIVEPS